MRPDGLVHSDGPAILAGSDAPSLQVPEGFDIFSSRFSRDGEDLVIAAEGGPPLTVIDYFTSDSPLALEMPNGAMLRGDTVELLAGPRAPGQYAQADAPADAPGGAEAIGRVETLSGSCTATRVSGETVELGQGDPVFQGDVIETAGDSTLGIRLEDGTLASMSAQSRLVLNEFVYETGGSDNWMVVDLVEGAFAFLTGAIAPSGGMEITTPVAVMAIRGTMPVAFVAGEGGASQFFAASDQDYELLHLTTREVLAVISSESGFSLSSPDAPLEAIQLDPETLDEIDGLLEVLNDAAAELGLLGIQHESGFHTYTPFGDIDGNLASLIEFLLLLDGALAEEAVLEVDDPDQFLMAEAELIAAPDQATTDEMHPVIVDVLDNDGHPDDQDLTVVFADVPNGQGSVTVQDGQFLVFDPGSDFDYLALGETTDVVITYVVSDSTGAVASSTATVTLTGINQAPVVAPVGGTSLDEQTDTTALNATIPVTFTDVDLSNVGHEAAVVGVAVSGENGGLTLDDAALMALVSPGTAIKNAGDGSGSVDFAFTAPSSVFDYLADGEIVTLTYTIEIDDGDGGTTQQTFGVTINGTNDAPVIDETLSDVAATVVEDGFGGGGNPLGEPDASGQIAASDVDNGGRTFSAQTNGSYGVFAISATGAWTYTLDDAAAEHLALGQTRTEVFEVTVTDGFGATDVISVTITVQGSNDAPRVQDVTLSASEDGAVIPGGFVGHDPDSDDNPGSLTYDVTQPGEGSVINNGDGTFGFDPGSDFQDLGAGDTRDVAFTYTATDSHGLVSAPKTVTVTVTGTNDVPVISGLATGAVTEDADVTLTTGGALTIADPDTGESTFVPQAGTPGSNGHGSFTLLADGTWSYSADTTQAAIQALGSGDTLTDSFTAVSSDGTATQTVTVTIHGTNDAPVVTAGGTVDYTENDDATVIDASITVTDVDSGTLDGAAVKITGNFAAGEDVLGFVNQNGITGDYDEATGVLTLSGTATLAQYQSALRSVTYFNSSDDPTGGNRTVSFQVDDGEDLSDVATSTVKVDVDPVNDAPVVTIGEGQLDYTENDLPTAIDPSISLADVDSTQLTGATVTISNGYVNGEDLLGFAAQNGITGSWNATAGVLTLSGPATLAQYQAALASVTYVNTSDDPAGHNRTISFQVNDGDALSNVATGTVTVEPVNDASVVSAGGTLDYTENEDAMAIDPTVTLADVDSTQLTGATVTISNGYVNGEDLLGFTAHNGITGSWNATAGVLTLSGPATLVQYQAALASVTYVNTSDDPSGHNRTISFQVNDGEDLSNVATSTVTVEPVNDASVVSAGGTLDYTENDDPAVIDASITIADVDNEQLTSATVTISNGYVNGEDLLGFTAQNGITGSWNATAGVLTLSGPATLAQYQAALASVTYVNNSDDPSGHNRTISFQVNDGDALSNVATSTVTVEPVNDNPVISVGLGDSDEAVLMADEPTPSEFVLDMDTGDPIYTSNQTASVTFFITRGGQDEQVTVEFLMTSSHRFTLVNLIEAINSADNGLQAVDSGNAFTFTLLVDGGALDTGDLSAVFTNPHIAPPNQFQLGVELVEAGTDAQGISATGTMSVGDVDAGDVVNASVANELTIEGSGKGSLPAGLDTNAFLDMMSIDFNPVIGSGGTTGDIAWRFDSGDEVFGFLDPNDTLVLTYTIAATDSAGAVTEHNVIITIYGAGSETQLLTSSSDLETSSSLMFSTDLESSSETLGGDSDGEVHVLTETDLTMDDVIIDYREGDVIDLTQLGFDLATGQLNADAAAEYVEYDQAEGVLSLDMDGAGGEAQFEDVAEFVTPPPSILVRLSDGDSTADIEIA